MCIVKGILTGNITQVIVNRGHIRPGAGCPRINSLTFEARPSFRDAVKVELGVYLITHAVWKDDQKPCRCVELVRPHVTTRLRWNNKMGSSPHFLRPQPRTPHSRERGGETLLQSKRMFGPGGVWSFSHLCESAYGMDYAFCLLPSNK